MRRTRPGAASRSSFRGSKARLSAGETILVTGASGGVGTALIQLAKCRDARVIAMATPAKFDAVRAIGADACIDREVRDVRSALTSMGHAETVDVVGDVVGGPVFRSVIDALRPGGRYGTSGAIAGPEVALNLRRLIYRDLEFHGATFLAPTVFAGMVRYIEQGRIRPLLARTFPLRELGVAQAELIDKRHIGNFVILI